MSEDLAELLFRCVGEPVGRAWCEHCSPRAARVVFLAAVAATVAAALTGRFDVALGC